MKFRLLTLVVALSLLLAACSMAEDITPPPDYVAPTDLPTQVPATNTPLPTSTPVPPTPTVEIAAAAAVTAEVTPDGTPPDVTPVAEVVPTPAPAVLVFAGTVTNVSGGALPADLTAALHIYDMNLGQEVSTYSTPIQADASYQFVDIPAQESQAYVVGVDFQGVTYFSSPVAYDGITLNYDMPVSLYETTTDLTALNISQVHMSFDFSTEGQVQVNALYVILNPGVKTVIVATDGTSVPFILLPEEASGLQFQLATGSSSLMAAEGGFALLPGSEYQYGIVAMFTMPYTKNLKVVQPFNLPVTAVTVIVPEGVRVRSEQLTDSGTQVYQDVTYHLYESGSIATGGSLTVSLSGKPGDAGGFVLDQRTWILIGVGGLGILLIGLGLFLFFRDRRLARELEEEENELEMAPEGADALGDDRESIMDAIIALDDQLKAGAISQEAYEKRRTELTNRLKELM